MLNDNPMRRQVYSVPALLRAVYPAIEPQVRYILTTPEIFSVKKIILTGCGDCWCAALAAKQVFETFLAIPIEVVSPLALSRYYQMKWVGESPCDPLVIAMSNSGQVTRVVEAVSRMRKHNALTLAVTANPSSPLAQAAEKVVALEIPAFESSPGVRSYAAMLMTLYLLAVRFGEVRLRYPMDEANARRHELLRLMDCMEQDLPVWDETAQALAQRYANLRCGEMIGAGCDYGSAWYGHEKLYEATGIPATHLDCEDWFHVNYFVRDVQNILTMVFEDDQNEAASRTAELVQRLGGMGRAFALVSNREGAAAPFTFAMPKTGYGYFSPLVQFAPPALTAAYLAELRGEQYSRGFEGIWHESPGDPSTTNSAIQSPEHRTGAL